MKKNYFSYTTILTKTKLKKNQSEDAVAKSYILSINYNIRNISERYSFGS